MWEPPLFRRSASKAAAEPAAAPAPKLSGGKLAYEARRAAEAGMTVEAWLAKKAREAARLAAAKLAPSTTAPKKRGRLARLLDRAHKPLG